MQDPKLQSMRPGQLAINSCLSALVSTQHGKIIRVISITSIEPMRMPLAGQQRARCMALQCLPGTDVHDVEYAATRSLPPPLQASEQRSSPCISSRTDSGQQLGTRDGEERHADLKLRPIKSTRCQSGFQPASLWPEFTPGARLQHDRRTGDKPLRPVEQQGIAGQHTACRAYGPGSFKCCEERMTNERVRTCTCIPRERIDVMNRWDDLQFKRHGSGSPVPLPGD